MSKCKKRLLIVLLCLVLAGISGYWWLYPSRGPRMAVDPHEKGYVEQIDGTTVLHVKGSPYEMGYQRGALLKEQVETSLAGFDQLLERAKEEVGLPKFAARFVLAIVYRVCEPHIPARYKRELEGLADGAGVDLQTLRGIHVVSVVTERGCSAFAVFGKATLDGKLYHGRNFDWMLDAGLQRTAVLTCYEPEGRHAFASAGYAATISVLSGMNMEGISISQIGATSKEKRLGGIPLEFVLRRILEEASNLGEVTRIIETARHTVGYNYVVADGDSREARAYETTANHVAIFTDNDPKETVEYAIPIDDAVLRADEAMDPVIRGLQTCARAPGLPYGSNSYDHRYKGMGTRIKENYGKIDQAVALDILKAVAMHKANVHSVLYNATDREMWVAHATETEDAATQPYVHYDLKKLFKQSAEATPAPATGQ